MITNKRRSAEKDIINNLKKELDISDITVARALYIELDKQIEFKSIYAKKFIQKLYKIINNQPDKNSLLSKSKLSIVKKKIIKSILILIAMLIVALVLFIIQHLFISNLRNTESNNSVQSQTEIMSTTNEVDTNNLETNPISYLGKWTQDGSDPFSYFATCNTEIDIVSEDNSYYVINITSYQKSAARFADATINGKCENNRIQFSFIDDWNNTGSGTIIFNTDTIEIIIDDQTYKEDPAAMWSIINGLEGTYVRLEEDATIDPIDIVKEFQTLQSTIYQDLIKQYIALDYSKEEAEELAHNEINNEFKVCIYNDNLSAYTDNDFYQIYNSLIKYGYVVDGKLNVK